MKKYLLLILTLFLIGCGKEEDTEDFTNSLKKQGYMYYYMGTINSSSNIHGFIVNDTTKKKLYLTTYNEFGRASRPFQEVTFK